MSGFSAQPFAISENTTWTMYEQISKRNKLLLGFSALAPGHCRNEIWIGRYVRKASLSDITDQGKVSLLVPDLQWSLAPPALQIYKTIETDDNENKKERKKEKGEVLYTSIQMLHILITHLIKSFPLPPHISQTHVGLGWPRLTGVLMTRWCRQVDTQGRVVGSSS
jgi:hypothetical protein